MSQRPVVPPSEILHNLHLIHFFVIWRPNDLYVYKMGYLTNSTCLKSAETFRNQKNSWHVSWIWAVGSLQFTYPRTKFWCSDILRPAGVQLCIRSYLELVPGRAAPGLALPSGPLTTLSGLWRDKLAFWVTSCSILFLMATSRPLRGQQRKSC